MKTSDRIIDNAINFDDTELNVYSGCGWNLAHFVDGKLQKLFPIDSATTEETMIESSLQFLKDNPEDTWLGMCSCCQFVSPLRLDPNNFNSLRSLRLKIYSLAD